ELAGIPSSYLDDAARYGDDLAISASKHGDEAASAGKKAGGAVDDFAKEPFLPDEYYKNNYSSMDGTPNSKIEFERLGSSGEVEKSIVIYDQNGKQSMRIDYSYHGNKAHHTNPHIHEYQWFDGGLSANEAKYFLDENGILRLGEIDKNTNTIKFLK
ncbi:hypothetical protein LI951_14470, partial [Enterococcus sp. BWT-B8]|uniref:hypothetical protein n=1 Tax=Enterococcus sp. BWT-B8 TaxID=2885157 RepID=UPI001E307451